MWNENGLPSHLMLLTGDASSFRRFHAPAHGGVDDAARLRFPTVPIHLGCMRPHGEYRERLDPLAVRAGVNVIVSPARTAVALARDLGLEVDRREECCAVRLKREGCNERAV